ncbi:hypothetical protein MRX96_056118 [Rhipicephalus microplus]
MAGTPRNVLSSTMLRDKERSDQQILRLLSPPSFPNWPSSVDGPASARSGCTEQNAIRSDHAAVARAAATTAHLNWGADRPLLFFGSSTMISITAPRNSIAFSEAGGAPAVMTPAPTMETGKQGPLLKYCSRPRRLSSVPARAACTLASWT